MGMAAILVMWPGPFEYHFIPPSHGGSTWNLASSGPLQKLLHVQSLISINGYYVSVLSITVIQTNIKFLKITVTWTNIW